MNATTLARSMAMRLLSSPGFLGAQRANARAKRQLRLVQRGQPVVHYFHQIDDPYSHLAVQKLPALMAAYDLAFECHLVSKPAPAYQGSSDHFTAWAVRDAKTVAADYGTTFPAVNTRENGAAGRTEDAIAGANSDLAPHLRSPEFPEIARTLGEAFWAGTRQPTTASDDGSKAVARGNQLRQQWGHYLGGMFYFEGEWFWGVDRLRLLEQRLGDEGYAHSPDQPCQVPQPTPADTSDCAASDVQLEYFPSLRSPYTAVGHERVLALIARSGVTVKLRPVMPMLMRGVPAPRAKQRYIIVDAGREARAHGVPFGRIVDPFGAPVRRAFALFQNAMELGQGMAFVSAYLSGAWHEGIDITTEAGLQQVAARAGIEWPALRQGADDNGWEETLNDNLEQMLAAGLWGVPSFRVTGGTIAAPFQCWGQDRIWRVENEIARRA